MSVLIKNIIRFCVILLIQVLILNKVTLQWWAQPTGFPIFIPFLYPLFLLLLPFETPVAVMLLAGFVCGLSVDAFMNTAGMHAFATVLIAYFRINVLNALMPKNLTEYTGQTPSVKNMGWLPFVVYVSFLIVMHHTAFFIIELWSMQNIGYLMLKILASSITSVLLILVYVLLFTRQAGAGKSQRII
ncbi:MAG: rod shape-determining protein MreD [Chitinophagales bacterium]|nr:rod shape-determining protein MreD [Chitinophagales bacterium]